MQIKIGKSFFFILVASLIATAIVVYLGYEFPATKASSYLTIVILFSLLLARLVVNPLRNKK